MGLFKRSMAVTSINFNCWRQDFRVKFILLFTALIVFNTLKPVLQYGLDNGAVSTPLLLPLLFGSTEISIGTPKICFHVGLILLLCDAPFYYPITPYAIMRSKRSGWCIGTCLYIAVVSLVYIAFITICAALVAVPILSLRDSWDGCSGGSYLWNFSDERSKFGATLSNYYSDCRCKISVSKWSNTLYVSDGMGFLYTAWYDFVFG